MYCSSMDTRPILRVDIGCCTVLTLKGLLRSSYRMHAAGGLAVILTVAHMHVAL